ncbi:MAG: transcription termination/antitermination protein NusG [bacterium]|nr:transcription termination/antitermination protein NusG [bacterium]MDE0353960.1 transcription termination/antitermination protein NusG [bacterium]
MAERTATQQDGVPAEPGDGEESSLGSLGAAFLSAGFLADGSRDETEPGPAEEAPRPEVAEAETPAEPEPKQPVAKTPADGAKTATTQELVPEFVEEDPISPYDKRGSWYVIHAYSGHERKVRANLDTLKTSQHLEGSIFEVVIPTEKVVEIKGGRKVEVERRMFPGYLLIRMYDDTHTFNVVRNTPGVTSFVGSGMGGGFQPTPLSRREVERFLGLKREAAKKAPRFRPAWEIGETVRVSRGPFADFNGVVENINVDQQKVTVLVEIFGRDTPMELDFEDIQKQ